MNSNTSARSHTRVPNTRSMMSSMSSHALRGAAAVALLFTSVGAELHAQSTPAAVLQRARTEYATVNTARAEFTQEIKNPLIGRTLTSRGTLVQRKPGRVAVTFADPAGDRIVSDGTWLWVYIPSSAPGQVMKLPAGAEGTGGVDLAATVLDAPREGYTLSSAGARSINGRATQGVILTAKAGAEVPFPKATVWIDDVDSTVREVVVTDEQGTERTIRLVSWQKNVAVDASAFTFKVPSGVRIVSQP